MLDLTNEKVLLFSDTHLTCKFDKKQFQALKEIIEQADRVIVNGDFWEYIACDFEKFIKSEWAEKLFPLLKKKKTIFLHGNHDAKRFMSWNGINKFADKREKDIEFKSADKKFFIEHGDLVALEFDVDHKTISEFVQIHLPTLYLWLTDLEYGKGFLSKIFKKIMIKRRKIDLEQMKKFSLRNKETGHLRIFGHVHMKKHNFDDGFAVIGEFKNGVKNCIFIENGKVEFFSGKY